MSLYAELKRRNVFRVAAAYLVLGWLFLQVASTVLTFVGAPDWVGKAIIALLVIGFAPTLAVAWVFEVGPEGIQRDEGTTPMSNGRHARRLDILTLAGVVLVVLMVFAEQLRVPEKKVKGTEGIKGDDTTSLTSGAVPAPLIPSVPFSPLAGSIAVLPFANMSPDAENEYFADGIAEELLGILSRIDGLEVASRTSSFSFKGKHQAVGEIARALKVAHVLEGSVRKQGARVRITAQLIDAATDKHLWSDTYDRDLTDIFEVQEEIAQAISDALGEVLGVAQSRTAVKVAAPTTDLDAYALYLRGRQAFFQRGAALLQARQLLEEAVSRDPAFAQAWAVLAGTYYVSPDYVNLPNAEALELAERAATRARELDDSLALPWAVLAQVAEYRGDLLECERLLDQAIARDPGDSTARLWLGLLHLSVGDYDKAEGELQRALEIDPLAGIAHGWYGVTLGFRGDRARGDKHLQRASELGWAAADRMRTRFAMADGDRKLAALLMRVDNARFPDPAPETLAVRAAALAAIFDPSKAGALHAAVLADPNGENGAGWSALLASLGMHREAIDVELDPKLPHSRTFHRMLGYPTARGVWSEPTFLQLAERDGLLVYWNAKGFPTGCKVIDAPERHLDCTERWR